MFDEQVRADKLAKARAGAAELAARPGVVAVYLCGSLTSGLGTSASDVDVYAVVQDGDRPDRPEQLMIDGQRLDLEIRTVGDLVGLAESLRGAGGTAADNGRLWRLDEHFDDAVRMLDADVVQWGPGLDHALPVLREERGTLRRALIGFRQIRCHNAIEDVAGFLDDGILDGALTVSAQMLHDALEVFLFGCDDLYIGHKWVWQKLVRSAGPHFPLDRVRRLALGSPEDPAGIDAHVRARVRLAQACLTAAVLDGWDEGTAHRWAHWGFGTATVHRDDHWLPFRLDDGIRLDSFLGRQFAMEPGWLRLWGECDGAHDRPADARRTAMTEAGMLREPG